MNFRRGKLYKCPKFFLMVYPSKEKAAAATRITSVATVSAEVAVNWASFWSYRLNCLVHYGKPGEIFIFLERDGIYLHVLFGDAAGWIIHETWLDIKEAQNEV